MQESVDRRRAKDAQGFQWFAIGVDDLVRQATGQYDSVVGYGTMHFAETTKRGSFAVAARNIGGTPSTQLDVRLQDGYADLVRDGIDLAARVGDLPDSTLVAHQIGRQVLMLVASSSYFRERGAPMSLDDLPAHATLFFRRPRTGGPGSGSSDKTGAPRRSSQLRDFCSTTARPSSKLRGRALAYGRSRTSWWTPNWQMATWSRYRQIVGPMRYRPAWSTHPGECCPHASP